jgi:ferredoxin
MPYRVTDICILCGACVVGCESNAITEGETQAIIDESLCVECGTCERNCPSVLSLSRRVNRSGTPLRKWTSHNCLTAHASQPKNG